jgi:gluconolactonase
MDLELVCEGLEFPEGPIAMNDGSVILTEIKGQRLTRVKPDGSKELVAETGGGPNGAAIGPDGAIYVTNNGGAFEWQDIQGMTVPGPTPASHTGGLHPALRPEDQGTDDRLRQLRGPPADRAQRPGLRQVEAACGSPTTGARRREGRKFGAVYYAKPDGSLITRQRDHIISPNGIGLSPDEKVVYVADTQLAGCGRSTSPAWAIGGRAGLRAGPVICNLPGYQLLDSLAVEAGGKVCVATIINGGITAFDPDGSTEHFPVPDLITTNICFGGPDMRRRGSPPPRSAGSTRRRGPAGPEAELQRVTFTELSRTWYVISIRPR